MTMIPFIKMAGAGNDFIIVDAIRHRFNGLARRWADVSRALCDRHQGIGGDGVLLLESSAGADARMRVFNPDGSEASMCGNGARCVALYLSKAARPAGRSPVRIATKAGLLQARVRGARIAMRMMDPLALRLHHALAVGAQRLRVGFVNTGVPHVVIPVRRLAHVEVNRLGRLIRFHRAFAPQGTNVNFVQAAGPSAIRIRTYERGVEQETLACGTGIVASAIIHALTRPTTRRRAPRRQFRVHATARSGERLTVSFAAHHDRGGWRLTDVVLEGSARRIFEGSTRWPVRSP